MATKREVEMAAAIVKAEQEDDEETPVEAFFRPPTVTQPSQVYSVRIPTEHIERLRRVAAEVGEKPTALMRRWVIERLAGVEPPVSQVIHVFIEQSTATSANLPQRLDGVMDRIDRAVAENSLSPRSRYGR